MDNGFLDYLIENDLKIFGEQFEDFLPDKIIDFHIHLWKYEFFSREISQKRLNHNPVLDSDLVNGFTVEDFKNFVEKTFPQKKYEGLFFGLPVIETDLNKNNEYIVEVCKKNRCYGLFNPESNLKEIPQDFFKNRFVGFKPYPELANARSSNNCRKSKEDISMFDFISDQVLEFCQEYGLILLIHIPRAGRLRDRRNIEELKEMGSRYSNIKIVLAHAGRSYCYSDIKDSINYLKGLKNLYVDTAMINNFSVIEVLLEGLGPEKILYGSDLPVAALKGKNVDINDKHYFITDKPRDWSLSSPVLNLDSFTFFIYEIIRSIRIAAMNKSLSREQIHKIFYLNAHNLINSISGSA
ncbi:MAG: amidohydrolase [Actinomycetia bacterium]|nr:amidohydrolase [Actinomycetes bacterium]